MGRRALFTFCGLELHLGGFRRFFRLLYLFGHVTSGFGVVKFVQVASQSHYRGYSASGYSLATYLLRRRPVHSPIVCFPKPMQFLVPIRHLRSLWGLLFLSGCFLRRRAMFYLRREVFIKGCGLSLFVRRTFRFRCSYRFYSLTVSTPSRLFYRFLFCFAQGQRPVFLSTRLSQCHSIRFSVHVPNFFSSSSTYAVR